MIDFCWRPSQIICGEDRVERESRNHLLDNEQDQPQNHTAQNFRLRCLLKERIKIDLAYTARVRARHSLSCCFNPSQFIPWTALISAN